MLQLKQMLDDLVDYAFHEDPKLKAYKSFYIEVTEKNFKSRHGDYNLETRKIRLMNTYRNENKLVTTAVHELAHHINAMQGNSDVHGKGFYKNYEKLLYAALDMHLVEKREWLEALRNSRDAQDENKVKRLLELYRPRECAYKKGKTRYVIFDAFLVRDQLKAKGFSFNRISKGWEIEIPDEKKQEIQAFLDSINASYKEVRASKFITKKDEENKPYRFVILNGYDMKDVLREKGFHYRPKDRAWVIPQTESELREIKKWFVSFCEENQREYKKEDGTQRWEIAYRIK